MLQEKYNEIHQKSKELTRRIAGAESKIADFAVRKDSEIPARIAVLQEQLKKIDEYTLKISAFRAVAEAHLESRNLPTIEAPPAYRVNLNRLRNWAMMIDPMSPNDPYAQRVYLTARCDECFLGKKKEEFSERIARLEGGEVTLILTETEEQKRLIAETQSEIDELINSTEMLDFAALVEEENGKYCHETVPEAYVHTANDIGTIALGACAAPLHFPEGQQPRLKQLLGKHYDSEHGAVFLPAEISAEREFAVSVICTPARTKQLDLGLRNLILNIIQQYAPGENKVVLLDAVRYNSTALGSLKSLENTFALERIPRTPDQAAALLEKIVSDFSDMDDVLDLYDSVVDYNLEAEPAKRLPRTTLILFGGSGAFESRERSHMQRILTNYERYGISFISIIFREGKEESDGLPEYASHNAVHIRMRLNETTIQVPGAAPRPFAWYTFTSGLPDGYAESIRQMKNEKEQLGSEYPKRYDINSIPPYTRQYKMLELPFGVDAKDQAHCISFEQENFAAYLVGASGSGKSTLLHTLIAGIIRNYHPDNVEIWLADFKQLEFKKYINHCPPHVKYILLDESTELVYDLIDRIYKIMLERQQIFGRLGKERLDQIDPLSLSEAMPLIFIVLDEFSVMSQAISESQAYKLRLQNILAKGRALGIRFLFSSQTFTKGIAGLTPTAKDQIQQRIAMKGTAEEINETLELSANLKTEKVRNWMDALPPYYALLKHRNGADVPPEIKRVNVMYFPDYGLRDEMIDRINQAMTCAEKYDTADINTYVDKKPVIVDGNTYEAFDAQRFSQSVAQSAGGSGDGIYLSFGTPRLMERFKAVALTPETRENILLIGRDAEQNCTAAVLCSAIQSFLAQDKTVHVWAYSKNRVFKNYVRKIRNTEAYAKVSFAEGISSVCDEIALLKQKIQSRQPSEELIVLIGMDRIYSDFEYIEDSLSAPRDVEKKTAENVSVSDAVQNGAVPSSAYEKACHKWDMRQYTEWKKARQEAIDAGLSKEDVVLAGEKANRKFFDEFPPPNPEDYPDSKDEPRKEENTSSDTPPKAAADEEKCRGAYNAGEDFQYIVKQGSRLGYHFLLCLNSVSDIKSISLKTDLFRHRMAFQVSADDSRELFGNRCAASLPEHICQYHDTIEGYSFRPYMHRFMTWDGWEIGEDGAAVNPYEKSTRD